MQWRRCNKEYTVGMVECGDLGREGCGIERGDQECIPTRTEMVEWHSDKVIGGIEM